MLLDNPFLRDNRVKREAKSLQEAGYDVYIFATKLQKNSPAQAPEFEVIDGIKVYRIVDEATFALYRSKSCVLGSVLLFKIRQICSKIDIIHVHDVRFLLYGYLLKLLTGARLIYDSHEYWDAWIPYKIQQFKNPYSDTGSVKVRKSKVRYWQRIWKTQDVLFNACDAVIAVSPSICERLQVKSNHKNQIVLVRNMPYYLLDSNVQPPRRLFHEHFDLPPDAKVLLYQGGVDPNRGVDRILGALRQLNDLPVYFVLMGPVRKQWYMQQLECRAPSGRLLYKEGVYSDEYLKWTASADIGVVSTLNIHESYYFSLPNKLFEYIQAGLPLVNPNFPDSARLVEQYRVGLNYDIDSAGNIAQTIRRMVTDTSFYEDCKRNIKQAKLELCWEKEQERLIELYETLAD
ncbi:MAG TPA: glycosyltransferase [Oculatellaceae cyanobacterium]|jgi:glycosyltransferase involved in cell wall biosynthesis